MNNDENKIDGTNTNGAPETELSDVSATSAHESPSAPPVKDGKDTAKSGSKKNKKLLYILIPVIAVIVAGAIIVAVTLVSKKNKHLPVPVTDANGVPVTDVNGEIITVMPETEIVTVTDESGVPVTGADGKVETTVVFKEIAVNVPVTDMNGEKVTDENGVVVTEEKKVTPTYSPTESNVINSNDGTGGNTSPVIVGSTAVPITDGKGNTAVDDQGNVLTSIVVTTIQPAVITPAKTEWKATQGGTAADYFSDVILTKDGGYIASNVTNSVDGDFAKFKSLSLVGPYTVLTKYDKEGAVEWQNAVGSTKGICSIMSLAAADNGSFYAAGYAKNVPDIKGKGYYDAVIYKFTADGKQEWVKTFGTTTVDMFNDITVTKDGGVVAVGSVGTNDYDAEGFDGEALKSRACIVKYSASGDVVWKNIVGGDRDAFVGVAEGKNGELYTVGNFFSGTLFKSVGMMDSGVALFDSNGKYKTIKSIAGTQLDEFRGITASSDGGVVICGRSKSSDTDNLSSFFNGNYASRGGFDSYIIKLNSDLNIDFATPFRGQNDEILNTVIEMKDGSFIAAGYTNSSSRDLKGVTTRGGNDIVIASFYKDGELAWARSFGGTLNDSAAAICRGSDGGYVVVGNTLSKDVDLASISPYAGSGKIVGVIVKFPE